MSELPTAAEAREQAMRMDIINKGGSPDVLGQKLGGSDELLALRARVAQIEAALRFLFEETKWNSVDKDNMEFDGRVTCYQLDRARAALKDALGG